MFREVAGRFGAPFDAGLVVAAGREAANVVALLEADPVFVHGDFFPSNVVGSGATMWTLDWELAAAGPGEFDLAAFVFGWPDDIANEYTSQYVRTRWPSDHPTNFEMRFEAARRLLPHADSERRATRRPRGPLLRARPALRRLDRVAVRRPGDNR